MAAITEENERLILNKTGTTIIDNTNTTTDIDRADIIEKILQRGETPQITINTKMLLFARWVTINYGTPQYNVNGYDGKWWNDILKYFNKEVYPNMILNGSVENTEKFLSENKL
jgi:hypothetical protein